MPMNTRVRISISPLARELAVKYGYLPYMVQRYLDMFGHEETLAFLNAVERGLPRTIRCNTLAVRDCPKLPAILSRHGIRIRKHGGLPHAFIVEKGSSKLGHTTEHMLGFYYIQGLASMLAPLLLNPKPGEIIADLAAAPGGKTTYLSQLMTNKGLIIAVDNDSRRIESLTYNLQRMRSTNVVVVKSDIEKLPESFDEKFDKVLLDAPCSAEGLLPIKPERKTSMSYEDVLNACRLQSALVERAVRLLRKGGTLLYTTCSIAPEENEFIIAELIEKLDSLQIIKTRFHGIGVQGITEFMGRKLPDDLANCMRVYPHTDGMEGFFYCLLKRS